jgi:hypothetical protein
MSTHTEYAPLKEYAGCTVFGCDYFFGDSEHGIKYGSGLWDWADVSGVQTLGDPLPECFADVEGPMCSVVFKSGVSEFLRADVEEVGKAWLRYKTGNS